MIGCMGSRLLFTVVSGLSYGWFLQLLGFVALIPVLGWFYIMFITPRDTGFELFGDKIWWKNLRPVHTILWIFFAYLAVTKNKLAWVVLLLDTILGLSSFLLFHWVEGNLNEMLQ
jgi:hypothetical protein